MGVKVQFKSGKTVSYKTATGYKRNYSEKFKGKNGKGYTADAWVIFFPNKKTIHYKIDKIQSINKY